MKKLTSLIPEYNPYFYPEKEGLEFFTELDLSIHRYEFNYFIIWIKKDDGTLWWDSDMGNSIEVPFGSCELKPITKKTLLDFEKALKNHTGMTHKLYLKTLLEVKDYLKKNSNKKRD